MHKPFETDSASVAVGGLTIEMKEDTVSIYGSLDITRDQEGLATARTLKEMIDATVAKLASIDKLPAKASGPIAPGSAPNPF